MSNYKLKLIKNPNKNDSVAPQYSLIYTQKEGSDLKIGYEIISTLKENNDIVIEVDTSLMIQHKNNRFDLEEFVSEIRKMNLQYTYKKIQSQKQDIFSSLFKSKKTEDEHVITAYVPDNVWKEEAFKKIIPVFGIRYYIMKGSDEARKVLDDLNIMTDKEKYKYFLYIIFDVAEFRQMGISSSQFEYDDIKRFIGIS